MQNFNNDITEYYTMHRNCNGFWQDYFCNKYFIKQKFFVINAI